MLFLLLRTYEHADPELLSLTLAQFPLASVRCRNAADHGLLVTSLILFLEKEVNIRHRVRRGRDLRKGKKWWRQVGCAEKDRWIGVISCASLSPFRPINGCISATIRTFSEAAISPHRSSLMIAALDVSHEATTALILTITGRTKAARIASQVDLAQKGSP